MNKKIKNKPIAFQDNTISIEDLPLPNVLYPGFYGSYFGFQESENSEVVFCSCAKKAIQNYIKFRLTDPSSGKQSIDEKRFLISSHDFPLKVTTELMQNKIPENEKIIDHLIFQDKICHECNKSTPNYFYCHKMYGGSFKQNYGWYINKQKNEFGIEICFFPSLIRINKETCPDEIYKLINVDPIGYVEKFPELINFPIEDLINSHVYREVNNFAENEVRLKFGHKKVGEGWTNETILYEIIKSIFPNYTVIHHYRPPFLGGLELDIFIKELNIGIEYQGIQHYEPIDHWGGVESLKKLQMRDNIKKELCQINNIPLLYFSYKDDLSNETIRTALNTYI